MPVNVPRCLQDWILPVIDRFRTTLCAALLLCLLPFAATAQTAAQTRHWVQVEAHPTLGTAEEWAARYQADFGNVAGFRLPGGWYALALGPFETADDAALVRQRLLAERMIPRDAYLTQDSAYRDQFWPVGAQPPVAALPDPVADPVPGEAADAAADPTPEAPAPNPRAANPVPAIEAPAQVQESAREPVAQTAPEETLAEARANDARLTRDERIDIQTALQWFGHYDLAIDAAFGPGTRRAIEGWQDAEGHEPTGFLTTRQRADLLDDHTAAVAQYAFAPWRDEDAGIEITLPLGMIEFDRHESPFVHFRDTGDHGLRVLLISQEGTQATLFGLYEIMQTLEAIPLDGERSRRSNGFTLTGESATARAHAVATLQGSAIKGWVLLWEPRADDAAARVLPAMQQSFRALDGALPDNLGAAASTVARSDLLSGLEVRRPERSRSGFYVDAMGSVVTTAEVVAGCERVTIDSAYDAEIRLVDADAGIAVLSPLEPLVPLAFAQFSPNGARLASEIRVAGYSYEDTLTRPVLTRGQIAELTGLNGEPTLKRLAISVQQGDSGGPVFDGNGAVVGMLLPRADDPARQLPEEVNFAVSSDALLAALDRAGLRGALSRDNATMPAETLTRVSADVTVLISCWN